MIDLHSHIIPGIDDGSENVEETFNMIKEAKEAGFTDVFLTPHFMTHNFEPQASEIIFWKEKLQEILNEKKIDIKLHYGMELFISDSIEELINNKKILTLNNSRYLLMELPLNTEVKYLEYVLDYLKSINVIPILAHPERYKCVHAKPKLIQDYIDKGCLIQCNFGSIIGLYGNKAKHIIKTLLKNRQVNFLGSDSHREDSIYKKIPDAAKKIKKIIGEEDLYKLTYSNPQKIINNKNWN